MVVAITGAAVAVQDSGARRLADELREHQATARVLDVRAEHSSRGTGRVEVTFEADGRTVTARAVGADGNTVSTDPAGLVVAYVPGDPQRVMLVGDVEHFAHRALEEAAAVSAVGLGTAVLSGGALLLLERRRRGSHAHRSRPRWFRSR